MAAEDTIQTIFEISCGTFLASIIGYFTTPSYAKFWINMMLIFGVSTLLLIFVWKYLEDILYFFWVVITRWRYNDPIIGILKSPNVKKHFTKVDIEEWENLFKENKIKVKKIDVNQIKNKYVLILNPYGETYPEEDLIDLLTLNKIKEYIKNGGLFINVSGIAFYYGYDFKHNTNPPLSVENETFLIKKRGGSLIIVEEKVFPTMGYSLTNTMLYEKFKVLTTWTPEKIRHCYQNDDCMKFVDDIANVGGTSKIYEFRALREQSRKWIPFLMADSEIGKIYPIAGIPYGRGCLILCGFHLDIDPTNELWDPTIHRGCVLKIVMMAKNLLSKKKKGKISLNAENW